VVGTARVGEKKGREQSKASSLALRGRPRGGSGGGGAERPFSLYGFGFLAFRAWQLIFAGDGRPGKQGIFFFELGKQGIGTTSVWDSVGPSGRLSKGTRKTDAQ
jgi:hypothetical protein